MRSRYVTKRHASGCNPREREGDLTSYQAVVDAYKQEHSRRASQELDRFRSYSLEQAVGYAASSELLNGKLHDHQRRVGRKVLAEGEHRLRGCLADLADCSSFDQLYKIVEQAIESVPRIGELTIYDITTRIGANRKLKPKRIYLHAGTREGAKGLGLKHRLKYLEKRDFPKEFHCLEAREIEDCLCIYSAELAQITRMRAGKR